MQFIDLAAQYNRIKSDVDEAIHRVLDHGKYIMGPEIGELECELAGAAGVKYCLGCSSGTDALLIPLMAWGIGTGDAVFTTPFTFFATAEVIGLVGATPVFVDICPDTYNMDAEKLEQAICRVESEGKLRPKAVIPVDLFGLPADYDALLPVAEKHGLLVLEDAAQAFAADYKGRKTPSFGHIGATSFFPAKPLGCYGDGGAIFTDDEEIYNVMQSIRVHGQGEDKYNNVRLGVNGRLDTIQAAVLLEKLKIYSDEIDKRQVVAGMYAERLVGVLDKIPTIPEGLVSVWAQYCVEDERRSEIQAALGAAGIPSPIYYAKPMHLLDAFADLGYGAGDFPVSEAASRRIFALPFHPYLTEADVDTVCDVIKNA
jgi:UDP-2-acetamido-2-deoxy-ribo-hexuluronate aminotransferase